MERELESAIGNMDGRPKKAVDWVALIDELWDSDDENNTPKARGESSRDEKGSTAGTSEAYVDEHDVKEARPHSIFEESSLEREQSQRGKVLKVVIDPTCPLEDPLTGEGDDSPPPTDDSSVLKADQTTHRIRRTRQTDLLSFIDHKYSQANRSPLTDVENSTHSDSTDDGYMTSDNSRVDYTPQFSLPGIENELKHPRALFSQKSTRRYYCFTK